MGRLFRILVATLMVVLIVGASLLWVYLNSNVFDRWLRTKIISFLEERFLVRVGLGSLDLDWIRARVTLHNLRISNRAYGEAEPAIEIDRIVLDYCLARYFFPSVSLDLLELDAPRVRILENPNGRINLSNMFFRPDPAKKKGRFSLARIGIKRIVLRSGLIVYRDKPFDVQSAEGALNAELWLIPEEKKYQCRTDLQQFDLAIRGFSLTAVTASMAFDYLEDELRFSSLSLESDELDGEMQGAIGSLRNLTYQFQADITVDLTKLPKPDFSPYLDNGVINFKGSFFGKGGDFRFQGQTRSPFVRFEGLRFQDLEAGVDVDRNFATVTKLNARFYDGRVQAGGKLSWEDKALTEFLISGNGVSIYPLLSDFEQDDILAHGRGSFEGTIRWPGLKWQQMSGTGQASYTGTFALPLKTEGVPFEGESGVVFQTRSLRLSQGVARTPGTIVRYDGLITFLGGYDLDFELNSEQSQELPNLARSLGIVSDELLQEYPLDIRGHTTASGKLKGFRSHFVLTTLVQSDRMFFRNQLMGAFRSKITVDPQLLELHHAQLSGPGYRIESSLRFPLGETRRHLAAGETRFSQAPVERFLPALRYSLPVGGRLSGQLQVEELPGGVYRGSGSLAASQPRFYGEALDRLSGDVEFKGSQVSLSNIRGDANGGTLTGRIGFDLKNKDYSLDLQANLFPLEAIQALGQKFPAQGRATFSAKGQGNLGDPDFQLSVASRQVQVGKYVFEKVSLEATARRGEAVLKVTNFFRGHPFALHGSVGLKEPYPFSAEVQLQRTPIRPYLDLLPFQGVPNMAGYLTGHGAARGTLKDLRQVQGEATFPLVSLSMAGYDIQNTSPLHFSCEGGVFNLSPLTLTGAETELRLSGTIKLAEPQAVHLKLDGNANLLILNSFLGAGATSGKLFLQTVISGPLANPRIAGLAELREGFLSHPSVPVSIVDARGQFKFTANQVSIESFSARTVHGPIQAEGGVFLQGLTPTRWRVNVAGSGLRLEYPAHFVSLLDVDLDFLKSEVSQLISGVVYVRAAEYTQPIAIAELILRHAGEPLTAATVRGQEIVLNVDVEAYQSLRVQNNLADIVASGDFTIRGTLDNPVILGRINIDEGKLVLEDNEYEITRGNIAFNNPRRTTPLLNFEAETNIREYTITVSVRGSLERLNTSFRAEPPLPTQSIISLLAVGQTHEEIFGAQGAQPQLGTLAFYGASAYLSKSVGEKLESQTSRLFGFERFSIDPFLFGRERNPQARITLGKQLTRNLAVTYSTYLGNERQAQIVVIEYALTDWLTAVGTRDLDGSMAIDFKLKKRF